MDRVNSFFRLPSWSFNIELKRKPISISLACKSKLYTHNMDTEASSQYKYGGEQDKINNQLHREIISVRMELGVVFDNFIFYSLVASNCPIWNRDYGNDD